MDVKQEEGKEGVVEMSKKGVGESRGEEREVKLEKGRKKRTEGEGRYRKEERRRGRRTRGRSGRGEKQKGRMRKQLRKHSCKQIDRLSLDLINCSMKLAGMPASGPARPARQQEPPGQQEPSDQ